MKRSIVTITSVFFLCQVAVMVALILQNHFDYVKSVIVTTGFWAVFTFLEARYQLLMNNYVRVLMSLTIFFDAFFGYFLNMYVTSFVFDKLLHVFGTYSFSLFAYILVMQLQTNSIDNAVKFILAACLGLSLGASYEILEFFTDSISHPNPPSQPSLLDTDVDLIGDMVGSILAGLHVYSRNFITKHF